MTARSRPARARRGRRVVILGALLAASACTSGDDPATLSGDAYVASMNELCERTNTRLADLPHPPEQISAENWAIEVARAFRAESTAASDLVVDASVRDLHRTFVTTTQDLADRYEELSETLGTDPDAIGDVNTDITQLSLGRDDTAEELGAAACARRGA